MRDQKLLCFVDRIGAERAERLGAEHARLRADDDLRVIAAAVEHEDALGIGAPAIERAAVLARVDRRRQSSRCRRAGRRPNPAHAPALRCARAGIAAAAMPSSAMNSRLSIAVPRSLVFFNSNISHSGRMRELRCIWLQRSIFPGAARRAYGKVTVPQARSRLHALGGVERGQHDALVAGAAAEIAGDRDPHLLLGGVRVIAQKFQ